MKLTMGVTDNRNSVTFLTNPSRPTFLTDTSDRIVLSPRSYPQSTYHYSRHHEFVQHPSSWQHQFPQPFTPVIANSEHILNQTVPVFLLQVFMPLSATRSSPVDHSQRLCQKTLQRCVCLALLLFKHTVMSYLMHSQNHRAFLTACCTSTHFIQTHGYTYQAYIIRSCHHYLFALCTHDTNFQHPLLEPAPKAQLIPGHYSMTSFSTSVG
jgi:hypothetical protein